jgi:hypothetical protein
MSQAGPTNTRDLLALKVNQWLPGWQEVEFADKTYRHRPEPYFFLFTLPAAWLKRLSGISRRSTHAGLPRTKDLGIQRRHDERRSAEIHEFVQYGYPWSELSPEKRDSGDFGDLRKPGWLPTAIVVNILRREDRRSGLEVAKSDLIEILGADKWTARLRLPENFEGASWQPRSLPPIEVVDGQHRLWAFEDGEFGKEFDLPVVAFHGLDISWQAYLFWTINIKPKRINASLAFDLYPLLRTKDWLEKVDGHSVYRETRAQELVEALWGISDSPWYRRINMLGESGLIKMVSQAAWIRSLLATFIKRSRGLFGGAVGTANQPLAWSRPQQAAFIIFLGCLFREAVRHCRRPWATTLRANTELSPDETDDPAFYGSHTLISTDQGVRGLLHVTNDLCYTRADDLRFDSWRDDSKSSPTHEGRVKQALASLQEQRFNSFLSEIARGLATYDWRTSSAPDLRDEEKRRKAALRGSGGYRELRRDLLKHLAEAGGAVGKAASQVADSLGYE